MAVLMAAAPGACKAPPKPAPPTRPAVDTARIADTVRADVAQLVVDFNAHDAAKVASHDAPDVVQMFHGEGNTVGPAEDQVNNQQFFGANPNATLSLTAQSVDASAVGDMAIFRSKYVLTLTNPKTRKPAVETGNYVAGYKPQPDGSWKMAWSVGSDTPAPAPPAVSE
jgi:ketosteroid isomerase-like protein